MYTTRSHCSFKTCLIKEKCENKRSKSFFIIIIIIIIIITTTHHKRSKRTTTFTLQVIIGFRYLVVSVDKFLGFRGGGQPRLLGPRCFIIGDVFDASRARNAVNEDVSGEADWVSGEADWEALLGL
jgi:hypothetical protein